MIYKLNIQQINRRFVADNIFDMESGEVIDFATFLKLNGQVYVTNLTLGYSEVVRHLFDMGLICKYVAENAGEFSLSYKDGECLNMNIIFEDHTLKLVNFERKFLQDFDEIGIDNAKLLVDYAESKGRTAVSLGADAFNEFLSKSFKVKGRELHPHIVRSFYRNTLPILTDSMLDEAKTLTSGYQYARTGYYYNLNAYDISKSYSSQLLNDMPIGKPREYTKIEKVPASYWYVGKTTYFDIKVKEGRIDFAQCDGKNVKTLVLTKHLQQLFEDNYTYSLRMVKRILAFKTRRAMCQNFINNNVLDTQIAPVLVKYNKAIANSIVGYMGKNRRVVRSKITHSRKTYKIEYTVEESEPVYLPIYLYVTGKAKAEFIRTLQNIGLEHILYANTDGLLTDLTLDENRLNFGRHNTIGIFKHKGTFKEIYIECVNGYCGQYLDGTLDNTLSGMRVLSPLTAKQYQDGHFDYILNEYMSDGYIHQHIIHR